MKRAKYVFEEYLKKIEQLEPVQLGDEKEKQVTKDDNDFLKKHLVNQIKFNNKIIMLAIIMLFIIFILNIFLILYSLKEPEVIKVAFNGAFTVSSLFLIINWLRKLWAEKSLMDVSLGIAQDMQPEQAAKYIGSLYWRIVNKGFEKNV